MRVDVHGPFFKSPSPPIAAAGQACPQLWDYEVVEVFFLNAKDQYVEVELCPHGQHLVLLLNGRRNIVKDMLPLDFKAETQETEWRGSAVVPSAYFPPGVNRFNAFAIHGTGIDRVYEALYPATQPHSSPDFHRLEYFSTIDISRISPELLATEPSHVWKPFPAIRE
ncbi:UPF0462 protein C4orf33 homolog isoform X2 [Pomacea canaliculata]|nr:UPF0462 protein C4orf33 homolog isoform X2 [Pomacea canaliculata]